MRVINVQILLIMTACEILDSLGRKEYQKGSTQVYDCRFWREPKQDIANIIMDNHIDEGGSVFYYWDSDSKIADLAVFAQRKSYLSAHMSRTHSA